MYDPTIGRFLSEDPLGFDAGDANLARYVSNSPLLYTDPSGLDEEPAPPKNSDYPIGHPGSITNLGPERLPLWWGLIDNNRNPNNYVGAARRDLHVRDMMDFFFNMPNSRFTLYVLGAHRLNKELRTTQYVSNRFAELSNLLEQKAIAGSVPSGQTNGRRVAGVADFIREMPKNIHQGMLQLLEGLIRVKADYPLLNFIGGFSLVLYYDEVDVCNGTAKVLAKATNHTTWGSATRIPGTSISLAGNQRDFVQIYEWSETVSFKAPQRKPHDPLEPPQLGTPGNPFGTYPF